MTSQDWTPREKRLEYVKDMAVVMHALVVLLPNKTYCENVHDILRARARELDEEAIRLESEASPRERPEAVDELSVNTVTDAIAIPVPLMVTEKYDSHTRGPYPSTVWTGAGFTLADVRRLAMKFSEETAWSADVRAPINAELLKPFLHLLDGEKK